MSRKRGRLEVIFTILKTVSEHHNSIKPTRLLRSANLSSKSFSDYYSELTAKNFVKEIPAENGGRYVTLTDKGFNYLEKYKLITGFINEFEL